MTVIPLWTQDADGAIMTHREAEHWHSLADQRVGCDLCYRRCELASGEAGWCKIRKNEDGRLTLPYHGQLGQAQPIRLAYRGGIQVYHPGALALGIGGISCTAGCAFCSSGPIALQAERLGWLGNKPYNSIHSGGNFGAKAMAHPEAAIAYAKHVHASHIVFAANEPLLTFEYTYDLARLAKAAGLRVVLYTNGFSSLEAITQIAPYIDAVDLGVKGSLDPAFYARWMRSPGAVEHVKAAALAWQAAGVFLIVSDLIPAPHMVKETDYREAGRRFYAWVAETLGSHTPLFQGPMVAFEWTGLPMGLFQPRGADEQAYADRLLWAYETARQSLPYAHFLQYKHPIRCHNCNGVLIQFHETAHRAGEECSYYTHHCDCTTHTQHVTDSHCDHCGVAVPVRTLSHADLGKAYQWARIGQQRAARGLQP